MPIPKKYRADLTENNTYHVYNRTNNDEVLFRSEDDYRFFLRQFYKYILPFADVYNFNLLPDHFHFTIRIKTRKQICNWLNNKEKCSRVEQKYLKQNRHAGALLSEAFRQFFISYAMMFNKVHKRTGNLFNRPYKRVKIETKEQFQRITIYVHANPVKHEISVDFTQHRWSSWKEILSELPTRLLRHQLFEQFGGKQKYLEDHFAFPQYYLASGIAIEK